MKCTKIFLSIAASTLITTGLAHAATPSPAPAAASKSAEAEVWKYKTQKLDRASVDSLLANPKQLLVIDVRRPDELTVKGSFPVYLNIQAADVDKWLDYIPKDRKILAVSNHAHRAGAVGDVLAAKGFTVAGATGSEDYEAQGGKAVVRVVAPAKTTPVAAK